MKTTKLFFSILMCVSSIINAQTETARPYEKTQGYINLGLAIPFLYSGKELSRSQDLRNDGLSYYENSAGQRESIGSYSSASGWQISTGFYAPIRKVRGLMAGANFTTALTGSQPSDGGYEEGYYFNYLSGGLGIKYYPFSTNNLYFKGDAGIGSVFTKNRFLNAQKEQNFFHQFGVGNSFGLGAGYTFTPFKNKKTGVEVSALYQHYNTRVEVNGIGNDNWQFGSLNFQVGLVF